MSFRPYPSYKDSGIEWLGGVPDNWIKTSIKHVIAINMGQSPSSDDCNIEGVGVPFLQGNGEFGLKYPTPKQYCPVARKIADAGDLLFSVRAPVGALNEADQIYGIGRGLCAVKASTKISKEFLWYFLSSSQSFLDSISTGSTFEAVSAEQVENIVMALPQEISEQTQIARFLDHETVRIDGLIEEQQRLIELLKEKRQAVISHAVTKGLNPMVPMKDSGVDWLGEVPAHWEVTQIKRRCKLITDGAHVSPETDEGVYCFVSTKDVSDEGIDFEGCLRTSVPSYKYLVKTGCQPEPGDVLFSKDGTIGRTIVVSEGAPDFVVASSLIIIRPDNKRLLPRYLNALCQSWVVAQQVEGFVKGAGLPRLSIQNLLKVIAVFPSVKEQACIADFLQLEREVTGQLANEAWRAMELLKERRSALISAAVTGKIDVRGWQPPASAPTPELVQ